MQLDILSDIGWVRMPDGRVVDHATHTIERVTLSEGKKTRRITNIELQKHPEDWHKIVINGKPYTPYPPEGCRWWTDKRWAEWHQKKKWLEWSIQLFPINKSFRNRNER